MGDYNVFRFNFGLRMPQLLFRSLDEGKKFFISVGSELKIYKNTQLATYFGVNSKIFSEVMLIMVDCKLLNVL
jgi:hypothetical protein